MAFTSVNPDDSQLFSEALHNWQEQNRDSRDFRDLTPAAQSAIMGDAQDLKKHNPDNLSPEGLRNREACERILSRRSR
jgi:hypothetical protein